MDKTVIEIFLIYLLLVNIVSFIIYGLDKRFAIKRKRRIPESDLFLLSIIGGATGSFLAMHFFHHKNRKLKFRIIIPLFIFIWCFAIVYVAFF